MSNTKEIEKKDDLFEKVIKIRRINKVVKGGKRLAFRSFVITGDRNGNVGLGLGKSKEVPTSIKKAIDKANSSFHKIITKDGTIPHEVFAKYGSSSVLIRPAKPGTGVIAGGAVSILLQAIGIKDVVAKSFGSRNPINSARAALDALLTCKSHDEEVAKRNSFYSK